MHQVKVTEVDPMMSPDDIARYLSIDYYTVRDLRKAGRLPPPDLKIGNRPRWKYRTIEELVSRGNL